MDLRRDQPCPVEEILSDLRADSERHFGILHHPDHILGGPVGGHNQSLGCAPPHLGRSAPVLVADHSAVLGLALASSAVRTVAIAAHDRLGKQRPALLRV
jgi:hypothetical protein